MRATDKQPSFTSLVLAALEAADDFLSVADLRARVSELTSNRATASLAHLFKRKAVGVLISDGVTYWYATPDTDDRAFVIDEKKREELGTRKTRKPRPNPKHYLAAARSLTFKE